MGRGRGYYDTFLSNCFKSQTQPPRTIALAYKEQILPEIPVEETDFKIELILYEK